MPWTLSTVCKAGENRLYLIEKSPLFAYIININDINISALYYSKDGIHTTRIPVRRRLIF